MNASKVIKFYFYFTLLLVSMASLSYNSTVNTYYVSVLHTVETRVMENFDDAGLLIDRVVPIINYDTFAKANTKKFLTINNENHGTAHLNIFNDPYKAFAIPGEKNVYLMSLKFKASDQPIRVSSIKFKAGGVHSSNIEYAVLKFGEDKTVFGDNMQEGYFVFKGLNFEVSKNTEKELQIFIDLASGLTSGDRIRLDIEKAEDIVLMVGNSPYQINEYYPMQGKALSVVGVYAKAEK